GSTEEQYIFGIAGGDPVTVTLPAMASLNHNLSDATPIIVANKTRNVLVRSSGAYSEGRQSYVWIDSTADVDVTYGEFAHLGANGGENGFTSYAANALISSSSFHDNWRGLHLDGGDDAEVSYNLIDDNSYYGLSTLNNADGLLLRGNTISRSGNDAMNLMSNQQSRVEDNWIFSNPGVGMDLSGVSRAVIMGNRVFSHATAIQFAGNCEDNVVLDNDMYNNSGGGLRFGNISAYAARGTLAVGNRMYGNGQGIYLDQRVHSGENYFVSNHSFGNSEGIYVRQDVSSVTFVGGGLGYRPDGSADPNGTDEIVFGPPGFEHNLTLKGVRVNPNSGMELAGLNGKDRYLVSYNQDLTTGTVRVWGDYEIRASTLTLDYASRLYTSTATSPILTRGSGHGITLNMTSELNTLNELITVRSIGSNLWSIEGSSSGVLDAAFPCAPSGSCPYVDPLTRADFTLNPGGTVSVGDGLDFVTLAASPDASHQKELLFGPGDPAKVYNTGRSKLTVAPDAGLKLKGIENTHTLVSMLDFSSTYYMLVDSGAFTAEFTSFTYMSPEGIQLADGENTISISSSVFDYLGVVGETNTYITARDLRNAGTFDNVAFLLPQLPGGNVSVYNVLVDGDPAGLDWTFTTSTGSRWGEDYDDDASDKVFWPDCLPVTNVASGNWSDYLTWDGQFVPTACNGVTIVAATSVTLDTLNAISSAAVILGTVTFSRGAHSSWTLVGGDLEVRPGGLLDMGRPGDYIDSFNAHLLLSSGNFAGQYGMVIEDGGMFTVRGATKPPFAMGNQSIAANGTEVRVSASSTTNWSVGDTIVIGPTSGAGNSSSDEKVITAIVPAAPDSIIQWSGGVSERVLNTTSPIVVANITHNVVVRSSGIVVNGSMGNSAYVRSETNDAGAFSAKYTEFAYLGANASGKFGVLADSIDAVMEISSSALHDGYRGIALFGASSGTYVRNVIYDSFEMGFWMTAGAMRNRVENNIIVGNGTYGMSIGAGNENDFIGNAVFSNAQEGMIVGNSSYGNRIEENYLACNGDHGISFGWKTERNLIRNNMAYLNGIGTGSGIMLGNLARDNYVTGNKAWGNDDYGIFLSNAYENVIVSNEIHDNGAHGMFIDGNSWDNRLISNRIYGNTNYGIYVRTATGTMLTEDWLGYDAGGGDVPNGTAEFHIDGGNQGDAQWNGVRVNPAVLPLTSAGFTQERNHVASFQQDFDTGTVRIWGDYGIYGSTATIDYSARLYDAGYSGGLAVKGPYQPTANFNVNNGTTLSELITVTYTGGGNWDVEGSSSGVIGQIAGCNPGGGWCVFANIIVSVDINPDPATVVGDRVAFFTTAGSDDLNYQKKVLFGEGSPTFRGGRSRFTVSQDGGLELIGIPGYPTIVDWISPGDTYYALVSSGMFTAVHSSISNMDRRGLQIYGNIANSGVYLATTTMDWMGSGDLPFGAYITAYDYHQTGPDFHGVEFGDSRQETPIRFNVRVENPIVSLQWDFYGRPGDLWGEANDSDPGTYVTWHNASCEEDYTVQSGSWSHASTWQSGFVPTECTPVKVQSGHTLVVDTWDAISSGTVIVGTVTFSRSAHSSWTMVGGDLIVQPDGRLDIGNKLDPIPAGTTAHLVLAHAEAASYYGLTVQAGGMMSVYGAVKTPASIIVPNPAWNRNGDDNFPLDVDPASLGWEVGDEITVGPTQGEGAGTTMRGLITNIAGQGITLDPGNTITPIHYATTPIEVANLTRNVLVRSSGTVVNGAGTNTSYIRTYTTFDSAFSLTNAEFAYLGVNMPGKEGITFDGASVRGKISTCTIRDGYKGVVVTDADDIVLSYNLSYSHFGEGFKLTNVVNSTLAYNHSYGNTDANDGSGISVLSESNRNALFGNHLYSNEAEGIKLSGSSYLKVSSNTVYSNANGGVYVMSSHMGDFESNRVYRNVSRGFYVVSSTGNKFAANDVSTHSADGFRLDANSPLNVLSQNRVFHNGSDGILIYSSSNTIHANEVVGNGNGIRLLAGGTRNLVSGNDVYDNTLKGIGLENGAYDNTLIENSVAGNVYGLYVFDGSDNESYEDRYGYKRDWTESPNTSGEIQFEPGVAGFLDILYASVNPAVGISTEGFELEGTGMASTNQNADSGTLRVWGDFRVDEDTITLRYDTELDGAWADEWIQMRGPAPVGHSLSGLTASADAANEVITVYYDGSDWRMEGSRSGALWMANCGPAPCPADFTGAPKAQFTLNVAAPLNESDRIDFITVSGSGDQDMQKKFLFGPTAKTYREGRSRMVIDPTGGIEMVGVPGYPTILSTIDPIGPGSTYYSFVSSGYFHVEYSSISNMDSDGIWLGDTGDVTIATTTFDNMAVANATGTYITMIGLGNPATTFYGVEFGNTRSTDTLSYAYNIRAIPPNTSWTLRRWKGLMGGDQYDYDEVGVVDWAPFLPVPGVPPITEVFLTSVTVQWGPGANDEGILYRVHASSTNWDGTGVEETSGTYAFSAGVESLLTNTTYWLQVRAEDPPGLGGSPAAPLGSTSTLTLPVSPAAVPFPTVLLTSVAVSWAQMPALPQSDSAEGYVLEASSTNFDGSGVLHSSKTTELALSTLWAGLSTGLLGNTTYYFRVGSINWNGVPNYVTIGSTSTLAPIPSLVVNPLDVHVTSITVSWFPFPPSPPAPQELSCEGYIVQASSTDFDGTGVVLSSVTHEVNVGSLQVWGLTSYVTYYLRVGTLNWSDQPNWEVLTSTVAEVFHSTYMAGTGLSTWGVAWGDYDGDGDLDYAAANGSPVYMAERQPDGTYVKTTMPGLSGNSYTVAWADYDNDGDLDLAVGTDAQDELAHNDGGSFAWIGLPGASGESYGMAWGDYDNDGDLDIAISSGNGYNDYVMRNDGGSAFTKVYITGSDGNTRGVVWGDYDNDGDLDLALANAGGAESHVMRNDGDDNWTKFAIAGTSPQSWGIAWGDLDKDGDLDLALSVYAGLNFVIENQGGDTFAAFALGSTGRNTGGVAIADYDNDGDLDMTFGNVNQHNTLWRNNGSSLDQVDFTEQVLYQGEARNTMGISWGDYDSDSDLDLLTANSDFGDEFVMRNDLDITNAPPTAPADPSLTATYTEYSEFASSGVLKLAWDDGTDAETTDPDMLDYMVRIGTSGSATDDFLMIPDYYSQDGFSGGGSHLYSMRLTPAQRGIKLSAQKETTFYWDVRTTDSGWNMSPPSGEEVTSLASPAAITQLQVTAIVSTGLGASSMTVTLTWTSPGDNADQTAISAGQYDIRYSTFVPMATEAAYMGASYRILITTDVSPGDLQTYEIPYLDASATHYFAITTRDGLGVRSGLSNGATALAYVMDLAGTAGNTWSVAAGDYDKDGDLDLAFAVQGAGEHFIARNMGAGVFSTFTLTGSGGDDSTTAAWGDFDNDGDLDLAIANSSNQDEDLWRNDGGGVFTEVAGAFSTGGSAQPNSLAWGDYDNDGDLDLAVAHSGGTNEYVARNEGDGTFTSIEIAGTGGDSYAVAWGDYDNDGDLDLAVANYSAQDDFLIENKGVGVLEKVAPNPLGGTGLNTTSVAWGDYDNDGDLDLAFANYSGEEYIARNDGGGTFATFLIAGTAGTNSRDVAWADFDVDGDLDLFVMNTSQPDYIGRNDGGGTFAKVVLSGTVSPGLAGVWGDFDSDGDLDTAVAVTSQGDYILRNDTTTVNAAPQAPTLLAADLSLEFDADFSTFTIKWDAADYDNNGDTTTVYYALTMATDNVTLAGDERIVNGPNTFIISPERGSPLLGNYLRPAYKTWPGDGTEKHGVILHFNQQGSKLLSDATYYMRLQTVDMGLARSTWSAQISSYVFVDQAPAGRVISDVFRTSITVAYSAVPGGTLYTLEASSASDFSGSFAPSSNTADVDLGQLSVEGLDFNTTYYMRMGVLYRNTTSWADVVPASTSTLTNEPTFAAVPFPVVEITSMTVAWNDNGNPAGTRYEVNVSSFLPFTTPLHLVSTVCYGSPAADMTGLLGNTTYYLIVRALNHNNVASEAVVLDSTSTRITGPTDIYFDEISTTSIVASAYAPTPAFMNLHEGLSGTDVSLDGGWAGWHGSTWTSKAPMPTARRRFSAGTANGRMFFMGGVITGYSAKNEEYDPNVDSWFTRAAMPASLGGPGVVGSDGKVYAMGGVALVLGDRADVYAYNPDTDGWATLEPMPTARSGLAGAALGESVFAVGAGVANEQYYVGSDTWVVRSPLGTSRGYFVLGNIRDSLYAAGAGSLEFYEPATDSWTPGSPPTMSLSGVSGAVVGGKLHMVGGSDGSLRYDRNEEYDPLADQWYARVPMTTSRSDAAAVALDGKIYVAGGYNGGVQNWNEEYDPGVAGKFSSLTPNTQYTFTAKARNQLGHVTAESVAVTTYTLAAIPSTATPTFPDVFTSSVTLDWTNNDNPGITEYFAEASTATDFTGDLFTSAWGTAVSTDVAGLTPNTTYEFRVKARNFYLHETGYKVLGTTPTLAMIPESAVTTYTAVFQSSFTVNWEANNNPAGTFYWVTVSTGSPLQAWPGNIWISTEPQGAPSVEYTGLDGNTTYYAYAAARNHAGILTQFTALGSTATMPSPPASAVSTFSAVLYSSFTTTWNDAGNILGTEYRAVVSTGSTYNAYPSNVIVTTRCYGTPEAVFEGLTADTTYYFYAAAISHSGAESIYTALGSTVTLARAPALAALTFTDIQLSSVTVAWDANTNGPGTLYEATVSTGSGVPPSFTGDVVVSTNPEGAPSGI
ncbi:FG-GAP-like repeat-containing protein, partial [Elusimicrobiota bacterium]